MGDKRKNRVFAVLNSPWLGVLQILRLGDTHQKDFFFHVCLGQATQTTFFSKARFFIAAHSFFVTGQHPQVDSVQVHPEKSLAQKGHDRIGSVAMIVHLCIKNMNLQFRFPTSPGDMIQFNFSNDLTAKKMW